MPEFKVGDRVKIVSYGDGRLGTVVSLPRYYTLAVTVRLDYPPGALFGVLPSDLEPLPAPESQP